MYTTLVREDGKLYAVDELGIPVASDVDGNVLKGSLKFKEENSDLIIKKGEQMITISEKSTYSVVKGLPKKLIGVPLARPRWLGEKFPFYDIENNKIVFINVEEKEVEIVREVNGLVIPALSNRCGGLKKVRFFVVDGFTTKLCELDVNGELHVLNSWNMKARDVTRSGTAYDCSDNNKCYFADCCGNFIEIKNSITLFSNAIIIDERWTAFEVLKEEGGFSNTRILMLDTTGIFDFTMPYVGIKNPFVVDAFNGFYLIHGERKKRNGVYLFMNTVELFGVHSDTLLPDEALIDVRNNAIGVLNNGKLVLLDFDLEYIASND